ncbi:MAG: cysteine desulfurase [Gemmatimonadetes bacterium]|nr:cysteine desulfurase [Gemmatimonadota bacterium]MDE3256701.1 cysteine desulfurase [Gemmatimonadota bacterium]
MSPGAQALAERLTCPLVERTGPFDPHRIRRDFPVLDQTVRGKPLVYLDNAATTQKPRDVLDVLEVFYSAANANVHRGVHHLSQIATDSYEGARSKVRQFLNAAHDREIIFTSGTTDSINLVARTLGRKTVEAGDEILVTAMEHHSNIVPWQMLCEEKGARLRVIPMNDRGELQIDRFEPLLNERTKLASVVHVSNVLGTLNPVASIVETARERGIPVLLDGAQAVPHFKVDVQALGCDFYAFSGHKLYGPTGIGVLYGRSELLDSMPPYRGGGGMIREVSFEGTTYADPPARFEAGTPHIAGCIALGAAIDYLNRIDLQAAAEYENQLLAYATEALSGISGLRIIGTAREKVSVISFVMDDVHPHDVGTIVDECGVAVRAGHHCAQPVMRHFNIPATTRAATAFYNTHEDVDTLVRALHTVNEVFH